MGVYITNLSSRSHTTDRPFHDAPPLYETIDEMPLELLAPPEATDSAKDDKIVKLKNDVFHQRVIMICLCGAIFLLCVVLGSDKGKSVMN